MKAIRIALTALALLAVLGQSAFCEQVWQERRVTADGAYPSTPKIWGDTVYWRDARSYQSGHDEIRAWSPADGEKVLVQVPRYTLINSVFEQSLVYTRSVATGNRDLCSWDPVQGERLVASGAGDQTNAGIYGQTIVWEDYRSGDSRVYMWDPVNGERRITSVESHQVNPQIWGDQIVYEDWRQGQPGIYMWSPTAGERFLGYGINPAIHEGKVVAWQLAQDIPQQLIPGYLWEWTLQAGYRQLWEMNWTTRPYYTNLWGDLVVCSASGLPSNVAAWYPGHGIMLVNQNGYGNAYAPSVYENTIAWVGTDRNIYLSTLVPEPSSLLALGGCVSVLLGYARTRRRRE